MGARKTLTRCSPALAERRFVGGAAIDWKAVYRGEAVGKVSLPAYPFTSASGIGLLILMRLANARLAGSAGGEASEGITAGVRLDAAVPTFELQMEAPLPFALDSYRVANQVFVPPSAYVAWAVSAFRAVKKAEDGAAGASVHMRELRIHAPLKDLLAGKTTLQIMILLPGDPERSRDGLPDLCA